MGIVKNLHCPKCAYQAGSRTEFACRQCRSILEVEVEIGHLTRVNFQAMRQSRDRSIWRWFDFFPVEDRSSIVSLGEGSTPLIHARRLGESAGLTNLHLKNDTVLPTGSLKEIGRASCRERV